MKESDNWNRPDEYPPPPRPDAGEPMHKGPWQGYGVPQGYPQTQHSGTAKRKFVAGLLAFFVPGTGHMYLGLMVKGIVLMLLIALDITAIVHVAEGENILSVVLLSLLLPIIYFYNLFDAIQSTEVVNDFRASRAMNPQIWGNGTGGQMPSPAGNEQLPRNMPPVAILVLAAAGVVILLMSGFNWRNWLFDSVGSALGALVLIGAGVALWFWEGRGRSHKRN
ncbi:DUF6677 family protein [Cohnella terricola]|uniref:Uncharacterized protein n=1 Tax=Cohnella terricola TaxID=1289167 RepID=A0A559J6D5_9BACL|nr:DUF6677 family protein [Cohnella terricola]TVX95448.1 hypothetical protein FPZ45_23250 [Cohnella terricola]